MYARATSGDKLNNNKFSICSIRNISAVLTKKRDQCFVGEFSLINSSVPLSKTGSVLSCCCVCAESGQPICGNGLVEGGEQCDCGYSDQCKDDCCYSANEEEGKKCKLKPGKLCRSDVISVICQLFFLTVKCLMSDCISVDLSSALARAHAAHQSVFTKAQLRAAEQSLNVLKRENVTDSPLCVRPQNQRKTSPHATQKHKSASMG